LLIEIQVNFYKQKPSGTERFVCLHMLYKLMITYTFLRGIIRIRLITAYAAFKGIKHIRGLIQPNSLGSPSVIHKFRLLVITVKYYYAFNKNFS
jgi:hypothetical protein